MKVLENEGVDGQNVHFWCLVYKEDMSGIYEA